MEKAELTITHPDTSHFGVVDLSEVDTSDRKNVEEHLRRYGYEVYPNSSQISWQLTNGVSNIQFASVVMISFDSSGYKAFEVFPQREDVDELDYNDGINSKALHDTTLFMVKENVEQAPAEP